MRMLGRILVATIVLAALGAGAVMYVWKSYTGDGPLAEARAVVIPRGANLEAVAARLVETSIIRDARLFALGATWDNVAKKFKSGEYMFPAHVSPRDAAALIVSGRTHQRRVTIPEGLTVKQVMTLVTQIEGLEGDIPPSLPEGSLLPDTWFYSWGDSREAMIDRQRRAMQRLLQDQWSRRAPGSPLRNLQEALVLASIVEKETGIAAERPRVAAVYLNRLKRGMRLQADPTVVYGITQGAGPLDRPISRADLENPHAWNTYVHAGLPPTPIANPGRASIEAVLRPAASDELFFVADGTGGHAFARTAAEHERNVQRLRAIERARGTRSN